MPKRHSLGPGFTDEIAKVTTKHGHFKSGQKSFEEDWKEVLIPHFRSEQQDDQISSHWKAAIFFCLSLTVFFLLFLRVFFLTIVQGKTNRELADSNRVKVKVIHAPRGVIYDRNGAILAANSPGFILTNPSSVDKKTAFVSREQALEWEVKGDPRADNLEVAAVRIYPKGVELAHVLGYVGEISQDQLKAPQYAGYRMGDVVGQAGVEYQYESALRGIDGGEILEVDSKGKKLRTLRTIAATPGKNVTLTIDASLQHQLFANLQAGIKKAGVSSGAAVAVDPLSGQTLALLSYPSFDNNIFTTGVNENEIAELLSRVDSPILNRSIGGTYPPGSTFKIISSLAAITSGKISPQTEVLDTGEIFLGSFRFTNWYFTQYGKTEGQVNLVKAIQRSNDTYFYHVGEIVGMDALSAWARKLKLGNKLDIDIPGEVSGLVPDDAWKRANFGESWYPGDTLHMAIGQGFVLTTPLQVLGWTSFIAADGKLYKPKLVLNIEGGKNFQPEVLVQKIVSEEQVKVIKEGLSLVPKNGGTAWPFFTFPISTAGKTGTAEYGDPKNRTHAWYVSFAPVDHPQIAMVVLVEGGGEGSNVAAPIAKEVYRWYFSKDKNNLVKDVYNLSTESAKSLGE